jgi:hypothetical protein
MSLYDWQHLESLKEDFISGEAIAITWTGDDVRSLIQIPSTLTKEEVREVLHEVDRNHDAELGVNWDTLQYYIDLLEPFQPYPKKGQDDSN